MRRARLLSTGWFSTSSHKNTAQREQDIALGLLLNIMKEFCVDKWSSYSDIGILYAQLSIARDIRHAICGAAIPMADRGGRQTVERWKNIVHALACSKTLHRDRTHRCRHRRRRHTVIVIWNGSSERRHTWNVRMYMPSPLPGQLMLNYGTNIRCGLLLARNVHSYSQRSRITTFYLRTVLRYVHAIFPDCPQVGEN